MSSPKTEPSPLSNHGPSYKVRPQADMGMRFSHRTRRLNPWSHPCDWLLHVRTATKKFARHGGRITPYSSELYATFIHSFCLSSAMYTVGGVSKVENTGFPAMRSKGISKNTKSPHCLRPRLSHSNTTPLKVKPCCQPQDQGRALPLRASGSTVPPSSSSCLSSDHLPHLSQRHHTLLD